MYHTFILQTSLEEAECAIENEESKVLRLQIEIAQMRQDTERRLHEKDEEIDNARFGKALILKTKSVETINK